MSQDMFERITMAGLVLVLVMGCSHAELGPRRDSGAAHFGAPNVESPNSQSPNSKVLNSESPNSEVNPVTPRDIEVAWIPPGPGNDYYGAQDDRQKHWSTAFANRSCSAIAALGSERGQQQLYAGLGSACQAVPDNDDRLWDSAEVALNNIDDPTDCLDQSVLRLLRNLVTTHRRFPYATIHIIGPPQGTSACGSRDSTSQPPPVNPTSTTRSRKRVRLTRQPRLRRRQR